MLYLIFAILLYSFNFQIKMPCGCPNYFTKMLYSSKSLAVAFNIKLPLCKMCVKSYSNNSNPCMRFDRKMFKHLSDSAAAVKSCPAASAAVEAEVEGVALDVVAEVVEEMGKAVGERAVVGVADASAAVRRPRVGFLLHTKVNAMAYVNKHNHVPMYCYR